MDRVTPTNGVTRLSLASASHATDRKEYNFDNHQRTEYDSKPRRSVGSPAGCSQSYCMHLSAPLDYQVLFIFAEQSGLALYEVLTPAEVSP